MNVSQERLSTEALDMFLKLVESEPRSENQQFFIGMCLEIKRLQAIESRHESDMQIADDVEERAIRAEAERDRYKTALEYYTGNEVAEIVRRYYFGETLFDGIGDRARSALALKGADPR